MSTGFTRLSHAISSLKTPSEVEGLLCELLTPCELRDLTLRWELMELLSKGESQRKISDKLGVSLCKITRGAKILQSKKSVVTRFVGVLQPRPAKKSTQKKK